MEAIGDLHADAFGFVFAGCDGFGLNEQVMQTPGPGEARSVGGFQQVGGAGQECLGMLPGEELQEALGADAGPAGKKALEVILTQANMCSQLVQIRLAICIGFDVADGLLNAGVISGKLGQVGYGMVPFVMTLF